MGIGAFENERDYSRGFLINLATHGVSGQFAGNDSDSSQTLLMELTIPLSPFVVWECLGDDRSGRGAYSEPWKGKDLSLNIVFTAQVDKDDVFSCHATLHCTHPELIGGNIKIVNWKVSAQRLT